MESQEFVARLTFFYTDGQQESYVIVESAANLADLQQRIRDRLQAPWCVLQLAEETTMVNTTNVLKVEINPALEELQETDLFPNAQRETALTRSYGRQ